jgi:O-antigen/teichoic acid export membrane protein
MLNNIKRQFKEGKTLLQFGFLKGLGLGMGMIAPLVIAKYFKPDLFGSYSLAKMIVFFFTTLLIASAQTPFVVFANRERAETGKISKTFSAQCVFLLSSILIFSVLLTVFYRQVAVFAKISTGDIFFMWLAFIGIALKSFLCNLFMAVGQRIKNSFAELIFGFSNLALILVFSVFDRLNLRTVFIIYPLSTGILIAVFIGMVNFKVLLPLQLEKKCFTGMVDFTKWMLLGATAVYFINWGDNLVLRLYSSMGEIGNYNLGYSVFKGIVTLTLVINAYFLPFVSQHIGDSAKMKNYLFNKRPKILLLGLVFIGLIFFIAPYVFKLVYEDIYQDSISVLRILLIGSTMAFYNSLYGPIISALKQYRFQQITNVMQILLNVLLNLLLVPKIGIMGAAVATVLAYLCRSITFEFYFRIKLKKLLKI